MQMLSTRRWLVFGANTDVGKTVVTAGVAAAAARALDSVAYLKPLQTGSDEGHSDEATVAAVVAAHGGKGEAGLAQGRRETLFTWGPAVSPHVAAAASGGLIPSSEEVGGALRASLARHQQPGLVLVESAGGVLSPGPDGTAQADLFAALAADCDLRVLLVGDGKLGGISTTLTAYEALRARGFSVGAVAMIEDLAAGLGNSEYVRTAVNRVDSNAAFCGFPGLPADQAVPLDDWYRAHAACFDGLLGHLMK